jgi:hypothetical protein
MRPRLHPLLSIATAAAGLFLGALPIAAQRVTVIQELGHAISPPLRTLVDKSTGFQAEDAEGEEPESIAAPAEFQADPVRQQTTSKTLGTVRGLNILGLGLGFSGPGGTRNPAGVPPDANAAVGATQIVETVNLSMAVFNKTTGAVTMGPVFMGSLWETLNPACADGASLADPIVLYDKQADRWVLKIGTLATPYTACLAVSETSDATGSYYLYTFQQQADGRYTGQKISTWPDAYYLNTSITNNSVYAGPQACAVNRSQMLIGQAATMQCIQIDNTKLQGMLPCDMDGLIPPPAGSPNYFLTEGPAGSNDLYLFKMHVDFTTPANTTLTGPVVIKVAPYTAAGQVPQLGTTQKLNTNGVGLMNRLSYRNFANATPPYESLLATNAIVTGKSTTKGVGMRWYELRSPNTTPVVYQQSTFAPDLNFRWMGAIAQDSAGDMALGYTVSSGTSYPSVRYTGRAATDPLSTMETESLIFTGTGYQSNSDRWGDYTSMSVDPTDDCTMWYTGQYNAGTGNFVWATRLFQFHFPACIPAKPAGKAAEPAVNHEGRP